RGPLQKGEWCAVDMAPADAGERWRFVVIPSGHGVVERHTREGQFRVEGVAWNSAARSSDRSYSVELSIPLSLFDAGHGVRINALRRFSDAAVEARYIARAFPDAGDVTLMPLVRL